MLNEAYVFVRNNVLTVYAGKKVGDLALVWVSQEQGDVQVIGYIEGAPPAPMANLTNKPSYVGATSVSFNTPFSLSYQYNYSNDGQTSNKGSGGASGNYAPENIKPSTYTSTSETWSSGQPSTNQQTVTEVNPTQTVTTTNNSDGTIQKQTISPAPAGGSSALSFQMSIGPAIAPVGVGIESPKTDGQRRFIGRCRRQRRQHGRHNLAANRERKTGRRSQIHPSFGWGNGTLYWRHLHGQPKLANRR